LNISEAHQAAPVADLSLHARLAKHSPLAKHGKDAASEKLRRDAGPGAKRLVAPEGRVERIGVAAQQDEIAVALE